MKPVQDTKRLVLPPLTALACLLFATAGFAAPGGGKGGGGNGGGGNGQVELCIEFRDHAGADWTDRVQSDGGGAYCHSGGKPRIDAYLTENHGDLYMRVHDRGSSPRLAWVDLTDCNEALFGGPCLVADVDLARDLHLGVSAEFVLSGGEWTWTGSRLDFRAMEPGEVRHAGAEVKYNEPVTGELYRLTLAPELAAGTAVMRVERTDDGTGVPRTWTISVLAEGTDDSAELTDASGSVLGVYHLPFSVDLTELQ